MNQNLSRAQFPVYEVGDPTEYSHPDWHVTDYGDQHKVSPERFGLPASTKRTGGAERLRDHVEDIPVSSLRAYQSYVYEPHVRNLASVPQHVFNDAGEHIEVSARMDGTHEIDEGHHRAAAAILRGDKTIRARIASRETAF